MRRRALGGTAPARAAAEIAERALLAAAAPLRLRSLCAGDCFFGGIAAPESPQAHFFARNRDPKFATNRIAPPSTSDRLIGGTCTRF